MFAVMIQLHPRHSDLDDAIRLTMAGPWATEKEAQDYIDDARRANLPYKGKWLVSFPDPR